MQKRIAAIIFMLFIFFISACANTETIVPQDAPSQPVIIPMPAETASISPTPGFSLNPVSAFYSEYRAKTKEAFSSYRSKLIGSKTIDSVQTLMDFDKYFEYSMRPNACIGRLSSSGTNYVDTLYGAANGSGVLSPKAEEGFYSFYFRYDGGTYLRGVYQPDMLHYTLHNTETTEVSSVDKDEETGEEVDVVTNETTIHEAYFCCFLIKDGDDRWISISADENSAGMIQSDKSGVSFSCRDFLESADFSAETATFKQLEEFISTGGFSSDGILS